jgi:hypothetical protein
MVCVLGQQPRQGDIEGDSQPKDYSDEETADAFTAF